MSLIPLFIAQRQVFEKAYEDGDWAPLGAYLSEGVTYEVMNMPFHCIVHGRAAVLAGFARSVERFDKLCKRTVGIDSVLREEGANVLVNSGIRFERDGAPPIASRLWEIATFVDGKIDRLIDIYDAADNDQFVRWMAEWGEGLDPHYV